jgi:hypothetical protein
MTYFRDNPITLYRFGNNEEAVTIQDISRYSDVIDQIKDEASVYQKYTVLENMRPDQVSFELYGTTNFYWTFFLLNDHIREQGWPLSQSELLAQCQKDFPGTTLVTATNLVEDLLTDTGTIRDKFVIGASVTGQTSGVTAIIDHIKYDLGQVVVKGTKSFTEGESILLTSDVNVQFVASSVVNEYLSAHHYENSDGDYVDLIDANGIVDITGGALNTEITQLDRYVRQNDLLKEIRVFKKEVVGQVSDAIKTAIRS